jgi:hypothetical protein
MDWEIENPLRYREGARRGSFPTLRSKNMIEKTVSNVYQGKPLIEPTSALTRSRLRLSDFASFGDS